MNLGFFKRLIAPVAAVGLLSFAPLASRADSVAFHTVVKFIAAAPGTTIGGGGATLSSTSNSDTLTASGSSYGSGGVNPDVPLVLAPGVNVSLGTIQMTSGTTFQQFTGARVEFDVFQDYTSSPTTPPGPGQSLPPGTFVGSADGTLFATGSQFDSLNIQFDAPYSFILPNPANSQQQEVLYTVASFQQTTATSNGLLDVSVNVQAVPLPMTASAGLALLAALGIGVALRRRGAIGAAA